MLPSISNLLLLNLCLLHLFVGELKFLFFKGSRVLAALERMELLSALRAKSELAWSAGSPIHLLVDVGRISAAFERAPAQIVHFIYCLPDREFLKLSNSGLVYPHQPKILFRNQSSTLFMSIASCQCRWASNLVKLPVVNWLRSNLGDANFAKDMLALPENMFVPLMIFSAIEFNIADRARHCLNKRAQLHRLEQLVFKQFMMMWGVSEFKIVLVLYLKRY